MSINYQWLVEDSVARLSGLMRERRRLTVNIAKLEKDIVKRGKTLRWAAARLRQSDQGPAATMSQVSITNEPPSCFSDAVRAVLRTYPIWLTPVYVRDLLTMVGFETGRYRNALADVHVALRRLVIRGEVIQEKTISDQSIYLWNNAVAERNKASSSETGFCSSECDD